MLSSKATSFFNITCKTHTCIPLTDLRKAFVQKIPKAERFFVSSPDNQFSTTASHYKQKSPRYPPLNEDELTEKFVRGRGPGGQATNKTSNCVVLKHIPTNIIVKCHDERNVEFNRKIARKRMKIRLDEYYNGDNSYTAVQKKLSIQSKALKKERARENLERKKQAKLEAELAKQLEENPGSEHLNIEQSDSDINSQRTTVTIEDTTPEAHTNTSTFEHANITGEQPNKDTQLDVEKQTKESNCVDSGSFSREQTDKKHFEQTGFIEEAANSTDIKNTVKLTDSEGNETNELTKK